MKKKLVVSIIIISLLLTGCSESGAERPKIKVPYSALIKDESIVSSSGSTIVTGSTTESASVVSGENIDSNENSIDDDTSVDEERNSLSSDENSNENSFENNLTEVSNSKSESANENSQETIYGCSSNSIPQNTTTTSNVTSGDNDNVMISEPNIEIPHSENETSESMDETSNSDYYKPEKPNVDVYLNYEYEYEILENGTLRLTKCKYGYRAPGIQTKAGLIIPSELDGRKVTEIGKDLLAGHPFFCYVEIPDSVTKIGESAFRGCNSLEYVKLSDNLIDIGEFAFYGCSALKSIEIPNGITRINDYSFFCCNFLITVILPEGLTYIGENAFGCCPIFHINIPDSVIYIGDGAFDKPEGYIWEDEIGYMGKWVVGANRRLVTDVYIKDGIENIANSAFYNSPYVSITIPQSVTYIGDYAFSGCGWLKDIYYKGTKTEWEKINIGQKGNESLSSAKIHFNS